MLPVPLAPLGAYAQFVAWQLEPASDGGKPDKRLYSPIHGHYASHSKPSDWGTYEQAQAFADARGMRVGFVFSEADPYFFLDIDNALQGGQWSLLAQEICARFPGCAVEVSQSGTGLHIFGRYTTIPDHKSKNVPLGLELYHTQRFAALTGTHARGSVDMVADAPLAAAITQFFTRDAGGMADEWTTEPDPAWRGPEDDLELLDRIFNQGARSAAAAFGGASDKIPFIDLWTAASSLGDRWPPNNPGDGFDHSNADQSLANQLAFWTGRNCERIERLMRLSALARPKWDTHGTYLQNTILKAAGWSTNVYVERASAQPTPAQIAIAAGEPAIPVERGGIILSGRQQLLFDGCIYVMALNKVMTPTGGILDQARFDVKYAGFEFVLSPDGKKTSASAWEAYLKNQNYAPEIVDQLCFRPELGSGGIVDIGSLRLANSYHAIETPQADGDPEPFLALLRKQLPVERDRQILLNYMASVKRNPGMKAQYWPVLQGLKGNGKTVLLTVMRYAVGEQYTHLPNMDKMVRNGMNFNGWIDRKLFLGLEEIYAANRREFFEGFKTTVTNRNIPIEGKGIEELTGDNRANGMITTNHRNGVPIERDERRYSVFFMAQQNPGDLQRDGLTEHYFSDYHDWMFGRAAYEHLGPDYGLRVINRYLATYPLVAELDPNQLAIWGPATSSMEEVLLASRGRVEQEVIEAIEEGRQGFAGDWVSSIYLDRLLEAKRVGIPLNQRREIMRNLGYDWHPALKDGRTNNAVSPDGGKPRLYCRIGSLVALNLTDPASVAKAYSDAQLKVSSDKSAAGQAFGK